jgi:hypothetical protein
MVLQLTTAESLVLEVLVAHSLIGAPQSTLARALWVTPQLEGLRERGLVSWSFDEDANYCVKRTDAFSRSDEVTVILDRLVQGGHSVRVRGASPELTMAGLA